MPWGIFEPIVPQTKPMMPVALDDTESATMISLFLIAFSILGMRRWKGSCSCISELQMAMMPS